MIFGLLGLPNDEEKVDVRVPLGRAPGNRTLQPSGAEVVAQVSVQLAYDLLGNCELLVDNHVLERICGPQFLSQGQNCEPSGS